MPAAAPVRLATAMSVVSGVQLELTELRYLERHTGHLQDSVTGSRARRESHQGSLSMPTARAAPRTRGGDRENARAGADVEHRPARQLFPLQREQAQPRRRMMTGAEPHRGLDDDRNGARGWGLGTRMEKTEVTARWVHRQSTDGDRLKIFLRPSRPVFVVDLARCDDSVGKCRRHRLPRLVAGLRITKEDGERIAALFSGGRGVSRPPTASTSSLSATGD